MAAECPGDKLLVTCNPVDVAKGGDAVLVINKRKKGVKKATCTITKKAANGVNEVKKVTFDVKESHKFTYRNPPNLDIPLREFINYVPQDNMVMYQGSITEPGCSENVTWLVNMKPHVILPRQVEAMKSLLNTRDGNNRNIVPLSMGRVIYKFDNKKNLMHF